MKSNTLDEDLRLVTATEFASAGAAAETEGVVLASVLIPKEEMQFERRNAGMRIEVAMISTDGNH